MRLNTVPLYFPLFLTTAPGRNRSKGDRQLSDPLNSQRHAVSVRYLLFYLIYLGCHGLFAAFRSLQGRVVV
jgi:hypothetical protein